MPQDYVGLNVFTSPLVLPLNGERAEADVSADGCWKALANRTVFNEAQRLDALLNRRPETCDVMAVDNQIRLIRLNQAYALDVTTGINTELTPTLPFVVPNPGGLIGASIYYLYIFVSNGTYGIEVSPVVPGANNVFKTGTQTHKYLGSVLFNGMSFNAATISNQVTTCEPYIIGLPINSAMPSTVPLEVPATVTALHVRLHISNAGAMVAPTAFWRPTGSTFSFSYLTAPGSSSVELYVDFPCSTGQEVDLWTSSILIFIYPVCLGWVE